MTHAHTQVAETSHGTFQTAVTQQRTQTAPTPGAVGTEERYDRVAEAAYLRAEHRGFPPGCELQDWLDAEAEVDKLLAQVS